MWISEKKAVNICCKTLMKLWKDVDNKSFDKERKVVHSGSSFPWFLQRLSTVFPLICPQVSTSFFRFNALLKWGYFRVFCLMHLSLYFTQIEEQRIRLSQHERLKQPISSILKQGVQ